MYARNNQTNPGELRRFKFHHLSTYGLFIEIGVCPFFDNARLDAWKVRTLIVLAKIILVEQFINDPAALATEYQVTGHAKIFFAGIAAMITTNLLNDLH